MLRHTLATLAYRASKAVRGAPADFGDYRPTPGKRSAGEILAHMGDLMDWGLSMTSGKPKWNTAEPKPWNQEVQRFFDALTKWDQQLAGLQRVDEPERIFQGPIADALMHTGQISLMRRMAGSPVRGESYNRAQIKIGQTGLEQPAPDPRYEFD